MRGHAYRGEAPRDQAHVAAEVVGGAQIHESSLDRGLAEEHRGGGRLAGHRLELRGDLGVQAREVVDGTAPAHLDLAVGRLERGGRLRERAVPHHQPAAEHAGQHRRPRDDAQRDQQNALTARGQPRRGQAKREADPTQRHRYSHRTGV